VESVATDPIPLTTPGDSGGVPPGSNTRRYAPSASKPDRTFDDWAAERGRALLTFATAVTGNRESARDTVQDALVAVYQRWSRLIATGDPDAYARRVIVNRHISWWRRLGRRERLTAFDVDHQGTGTGDDEQATDAAVARRLLATLPARQRAAVALRFYDDLPFAEIGRILDCPESTARSYVHRALGQLREQLSEVSDGE
jgi:RNA polymerase sigma-70 factor (sigma-E family)